MRSLTFWLIGGLMMACALEATAGSFVYRNEQGLAIEGYDPVAYFTDATPQKGKPEYSTEWSGAKWLFASAEHREAFLKMPEHYAPQYGGHCAFAASINSIAPSDPEKWKVVDGKLYLNKNWVAEKLWLFNMPGNIGDGNKNWPQLKQGIEARK